MTAREPEPKQTDGPAAVSMHQLLASCAAANAVSKPPAHDEQRQDLPRVPETGCPSGADRDAA